MTKLTPLSDVTNSQNETTYNATLNTNSDRIEAALENTLSRDGSTPNTMSANLDMNSQKILNLPDALSAQEPATLSQLQAAELSTTGGAPTTASYVTLAATASLSSERVLTAGTGVTLTDAGAGSTVTAALDTTHTRNVDHSAVSITAGTGLTGGGTLEATRTLALDTPVSLTNGGTGQASASAAFTALKQAATTSATGVVELATDAEVITGTDTSRAIVPASLAARPAFYVYKSANQTGVPHESYTLVTFDSERYDVGSCWNTSTSKWTPPAGRVWISGQIFVVSGTKLAASATFLAKVIKNGAADVATGMGTFGTVSGVVSIGLPCMFDVANGTDTYEVRVYLSAEGGGANTSTIDSNGAHTYFCGGVF